MITLMKKLLFISLEERMTDDVVFGCSDDTDVSCKPCERITESVGGIEWGEITGRDGGVFGSVVKVTPTASYLQTVEIEIFALC